MIKPVVAETITALPTPTQYPAIQEFLLAIYVNQEDLHETALLLKKDGELLADAADIQRWRLSLSSKPALSYQGHDYYPLTALTGMSYRIDEAKQALLIEVKPESLSPTQLSGSALQFSKPDPSSLGGFINYDIFTQYTQQRFRLDSLVELGAFNGWGVGTSNFLGRDISDKAQLIRWRATWTIDKPDPAH